MFHTPYDLAVFVEHHVRYKPCHRLNAWVSKSGRMLTINMTVPGAVDSTDPTRTTTLVFTQRYQTRPLLGARGPLIETLKRYFLLYERHERDEWFTIGWKLVTTHNHITKD